MARFVICGLVGVCVALSGCAALSNGGSGGKAHSTAAQQSSVAADNPFAGESARAQLNDGYSSLYSQLQGLSKADRIFYVKVESDDVQRVAEDVTGYSSDLSTRLETLSGQFPALDIHRQTTPPIIQATHKAQLKGTLKLFAPVIGKTGKAFERGLLIRLLGAMDQQRYLTQTLAAQETDPALKQIMQGASARFAQLFDEINTLLNARFYG